ncbi:MAG: radical SAM protein [Rhodobacter sp.]|nr:radical SAM protein [Rhodobacter sp.]
MISNSPSVDLASARRFIQKNIDRRQVNKIQHGFPSPRYWTERDVPVERTLDARRSLEGMGRGMPVNLYLGVPYCIRTNPGKCGYCLFPVEEFTGYDALEVYFDYLEREAAMYKGKLDGKKLGAVYFGGGTSNLYKEPMYHRLMDIVRDLFPETAGDIDITLEGLPQLFTKDKLQAIKDSGMNRISVGVQQINEELNALSGRKQTTKHVKQTVDWARELDLACNLDLIFGWPRQTVDTMVEDLETVIGWGVHDITHYELNVGGPTDFALNRFHELPSPLANLEMYRTARDLMLANGYEQITAYNFRKEDPLSRGYEEGVTHSFETMDTLGIGYAAITFFGDTALDPGSNWSFINWRNLEHYKAAIDRGDFPVECGFQHDWQDFQISMVFRNLFGLSLDRAAFQRAFKVDVYDQFAGVWDALVEFGLAEVDDGAIRLVGDGPFYTPLIQALLAEARYKALRSMESQKAQAQVQSHASAALAEAVGAPER